MKNSGQNFQFQTLAEEQRQNIQTKDDFILKKLKEIDEQNTKIEKLTAEIQTSKVKLEADFETEKLNHTKETKVLNDRLEFATTQVKGLLSKVLILKIRVITVVTR